MPPPTPPELLRDLTANPDTRWATTAVVATNAYLSAVAGRVDEALAELEQVLVGVDLAPGNAPNYGLIACVPVHTLWVMDRTDNLDVIEAAILSKLVEPGLQYPEYVNELALAQACALTVRADEARVWVAKAHATVDDDGRPPLHVHIDHFEAEWELRLGADGDQRRCRSAIERARSGCDDPAMAPWLPRLDALERVATTRWG
jgi:hypothetical protein